MPKPNLRPATIHYRRFDDVSGAFKDTTLEAAVRDALATTPAGKLLALNDDFHLRVYERKNKEDSLFLNDNHDGDTFIFGDLVHFTTGHMQALFEEVKKAAPRATIKQMKAPAGEFIHSMLYWYLRGNNVFVLQALTTRTSELEDYLSWLLTTGSGKMKPPVHIILESKFDPAAVGGDLKDIEEIVVGGTLASSQAAQKAVDGAEEVVVIDEHKKVGEAVKDTGRGTVESVLRAMFGDAAIVDDFLKSVPHEAKVNLRVTIGLSGKRAKIDKAPLKALETGLRNLPDAEVSVRSKGGKTTPLGELQLHYPTKITFKQSLWDPQSVLDAFDRAYKEFVATGKITMDAKDKKAK